MQTDQTVGTHAMGRDDYLFPVPLVMAAFLSPHKNAVSDVPTSERSRVSTRDGSALSAIGKVAALFCYFNTILVTRAELSFENVGL